MKKITCLLLLCAIVYIARSQSVGIGTNTPNASAQLDIASTSKGLLIPRMNSASINAILNPAKGLMVLDTAKNQLMFNIGTPAAPNWQTIALNSGWSTTGNAGTNATTNFIGTTDDNDVVIKRNNSIAGRINESSASTSFGAGALVNMSSPLGFNTAIGYGALAANAFGELNSALGALALAANGDGDQNVAVGAGALQANASGGSNTAVGFDALNFSNGDDNTSVGRFSLLQTRAGNSNTALGTLAGAANETGNGNVYIGYAAGGNEPNLSNKLYIDNAHSGSSALIYGEFDNKLLRITGRMEVNSDNTTTDGLRVVKNISAGSNSNVNAIYGENATDDNYGIGVQGKGGRVGVQGISQGTGVVAGYVGVKGISDGINSAYNYGVQGQASGSQLANMAVSGEASGSVGEQYGLYGNAYGTGTTNYGVYGAAIGGSTNYAGYFNGDVLTTGNVTANGHIGIGMSALSSFPFVIQARLNFGELIKLYNAAGDAKWHMALLNNNSLNFAETDVADYRLVLGTGGEVGIGKIPLARVDNSRFQVKQKSTQNGIGVEAANTNNHWDFFATNGAASNFNLYYNDFYKGTFDNVTGAYTAASDRRLKKDITAQQPVLNNLMQLQAYQYHYLGNQSTDRFNNGFMAQDVQKIFPDAVVENEMKNGEKRLGINYQYFTVLAIQGLQEQQSKIQTLEQRIARLEELMKK